MTKFFLFAVVSLLLVTYTFAQNPTPPPTKAGKEPAPKKLKAQKLAKTQTKAALPVKDYFELESEGFRIKLPQGVARYTASTPATARVDAVSGQVAWALPETDLVIMFSDMDPVELAAVSPAQRLTVLAAAVHPKDRAGITDIVERDLTVAGLPAKEVMHKNGGKQYLTRALIAGSRLFLFAAYIHPTAGSEALVKEALDSFQPINK